jgi:hypothetical protein
MRPCHAVQSHAHRPTDAAIRLQLGNTVRAACGLLQSGKGPQAGNVAQHDDTLLRLDTMAVKCRKGA